MTIIDHTNQRNFAEELVGAIIRDDMVKAKFCIAEGANVDAVIAGQRPAHFAVLRHSQRMLVLLARHRANLLATNNFGNTPWELAKMFNLEQIKQTLADLLNAKCDKH